MTDTNETSKTKSHAPLSGVSESDKDLLVQMIDLAIGEIDYQDCDGVKYKHPDELKADVFLLRDKLFGNSR
jgi:hypothetical protein